MVWKTQRPLIIPLVNTSTAGGLLGTKSVQFNMSSHVRIRDVFVIPKTHGSYNYRIEVFDTSGNDIILATLGYGLCYRMNYNYGWKIGYCNVVSSYISTIDLDDYVLVTVNNNSGSGCRFDIIVHYDLWED